jgi:hypothetical protein
MGGLKDAQGTLAGNLDERINLREQGKGRNVIIN